MKNYLILLFFCSTFPTIVAQIQFNPKIGWNKFKFKSTESSLIASSKERGYQIGADIRIGGLTYLQTGAHFLVTNNRFASIEVSEDAGHKNQLHSLRMPLLVGRTFLDLEVFQLHSRLGGIAHLPLAADAGIITIEDYEAVNVTAAAALGIELFRLTFDIQFEHAVTNFLITEDSKYHLWTFSLGYLF